MRSFVGLCLVAALHVSRIVANLVAIFQTSKESSVAAALVLTTLQLRIVIDSHGSRSTDSISARHHLAQISWKAKVKIGISIY